MKYLNRQHRVPLTKYGKNWQPEFRVLAQKFGLVPIRAERILSEMLMQGHSVLNMIDNSFLRDDIKKTYRENFLDRLKRMGMTAAMIGKKINPAFPGVYAPATQPVTLLFLDHTQKTGYFDAPIGSFAPENENKYRFIEMENAVAYKDKPAENLVTMVDGSELVDVIFKASN